MTRYSSHQSCSYQLQFLGVPQQHNSTDRSEQHWKNIIVAQGVSPQLSLNICLCFLIFASVC